MRINGYIQILQEVLDYLDTDKDTEGDWKWISGDDVSYTNWYQGQPSNSIHLSTGIGQDFGWIMHY